MRLEAKVGLFVILGIVLLFGLSTQIAEFSYGHSEGYKVELELNDASGITQYAKVRINGVDSGFVNSVFLRNNKAYALLMLNAGVQIPIDSTVIIAQESMLGGKYIAIKPGSSQQFISEGGRISNVTTFPSLDETADSIKDAATEFKRFLVHFQELLDEETIANFRSTMTNLSGVSADLRDISSKLEDKLVNIEASATAMLESLQAAGEGFQQTAYLLNQKIPPIAEKVDSVLTNTDDLINENKEPLKHTLESVDGFFTDGREVIARVDNFMSKMDKSQIELAMRGEYLLRDSRTKGAFSINYMPSPTRYYMGEVVGGRDYSRADANGNVILPSQSDEDEYFFTVQLGKRYNNWLFRGGLIESSAGVGIDYFALRDNLKLTVDIYDFGSNLDLRGSSPHVRAYMRYTLLRYIDAFVGFDNILNSNLSGVYMGIGLRFIDNDVKPLIGTIGGAGL